MLRIKDRLIKRLYRADLTRIELITMLELIKAANREGVTQVYYKDIAATIGCNISTFYNVIKKLEKVELIEVGKDPAHKDEITVGIYNNSYTKKEDIRDYVKIDNVLFNTNTYKKLCAGEIRVMLYLLFRYVHSKNNNKMYYKDNYKSIAQQLKITKRMAKKYLKGLLDRKLINIGIKKVNKKLDVVTITRSAVLDVFKVPVAEHGANVEKEVTALQTHYIHCVKNFCRRKHTNILNVVDLNNTAILMEQYKNTAIKKGKNIYKLIQAAISNVETLNCKTIHTIIRSLLERESLLVSCE